MPLKKCRRCGCPSFLARRYTWTDDGVITERHNPDSRIIVYEKDFLSFLWKELEYRLGFPVWEKILTSQRLAVRDYLENNILTGWYYPFVRALPLRLFLRRIEEQIAAFGMGLMGLVKYRRRGLAVMKVKQPFDIVIVAAGVREVVENLWGVPCDVAWREEDGSFTVSVVPGGARRAEGGEDLEALRSMRRAKREAVGEMVRLGGDPAPRCPACGLPLELSRLLWEEERGTVVWRDTGWRMIFSTAYISIGTIREVEREHGIELDPVILDISRHFHRRRTESLPSAERGEMYRMLLSFLDWGGLGRVVHSAWGEGYLEVTVANPLYPPRLVGRLAGMFESIEGGEAAVSMDWIRPGFLRVSLGVT